MTRRVEIRGRFWRVQRGMAYKRASAPQILWSASSFGIYRRVSVQYRSAWVPPELRGCTALLAHFGRALQPFAWGPTMAGLSDVVQTFFDSIEQNSILSLTKNLFMVCRRPRRWSCRAWRTREECLCRFVQPGRGRHWRRPGSLRDSLEDSRDWIARRSTYRPARRNNWAR